MKGGLVQERDKRHTEGAMIGRAESMETGIAVVFLETWKPF
jgi:hypothetical protein